tara:strand:- start:2657 stop:3109 length:453 start_codon:yes stop_codon:yes gene_type:complete
MVVNPTKDKKEIKSVLCDEWIYSRISEDGAPSIEEYDPPMDVLYLTDNDLSGIMIFHPVNAASYEMHIQMIDKTKAMEFCRSCIDWFWSNSEAIKITAQIPEIYPDVCRFAEKNGFKKEGINRLSCIKGGRVYSQIYYGLSRSEVENGFY